MIGPTRLDGDPQEPDPGTIGYYGVPVIQRPHWKWLITGYFFLGGIAGSASAIGSVARLCGGRRGARIARLATYVSFAALLPCPPLLILDLGRPRRFLNMLRVFRPSSPMSLGTWGLTGFSIISTLATGLQLQHDLGNHVQSQTWLHRPNPWVPRLLAACAIPFGLFVAGYTGVLLATTAVPLWSKRPQILAPLFLASAISSGAASIAAMAAITEIDDHQLHDELRQMEMMAAGAEGMLLTAWLITLGSTARPISEGRLGSLVRHGGLGAGIVAPMVLAAGAHGLPRRLRRAVTMLSSALTLGGVFALRYAVVEGGRRSADDPRATFELTA